MRIVASDAAVEHVRERGGRLYVWKCSTRCCRGRFDWLESSTEPKSGSEFRLAAANGLEVHVPTTLRELPDELHVELKRFPRRRVEAYWNGCAWLV